MVLLHFSSFLGPLSASPRTWACCWIVAGLPAPRQHLVSHGLSAGSLQSKGTREVAQGTWVKSVIPLGHRRENSNIPEELRSVGKTTSEHPRAPFSYLGEEMAVYLQYCGISLDLHPKKQKHPWDGGRALKAPGGMMDTELIDGS